MSTSGSGTTTTQTISIPVTAAWHAVVGGVLMLIAATSFWVHFELGVDHPYRGTAATVGLGAGSGALAYWLWCAIQCLRCEIAEHRAATDELAEDVDALRDDLARIEGAITALQDCYLEEGQPSRTSRARSDHGAA